jgi:hypothetical protein
MTDLETRLNDALTDLTDNVQVRGDAWQEHQRRFATSHPRRTPWLVVAAAAVVLVLGLVAATELLDHGSREGLPASGSGGDPWAMKNYLGEPVVAETLTMGGQPVRHELVLTDTSGKGPSLCDRYVGSSSGSGGCTSRDPAADTKGVAFDWLTGSQGGGVHSVVGAVDDRVTKVLLWMSNGDVVPADLQPGGWEGTQVFALTVPDTGPTPQRVVAYSDASGTVLQAVDLVKALKPGWLPAEPTCGKRRDAPSVTHLLGPNGATESATAQLGYTTANIRIVTNGGSLDASQCVVLGSGSLASASVAGSIAMVIVGPEIADVRVRTDDGAGVVTLLTPARTLWQIAVVRLPSLGSFESAEVAALDATGHVVVSTTLTDLRSTGPQSITQL